MRLATFNILHGRSLSDGRVDLARFAAAIRDLDVDILALQEVDRGQPRSHRADLTAVAAEAMGAAAHRFVAALAGTPGGTWTTPASGAGNPDTAEYGIALLSRYPALSWQAVRLPRVPVRAPAAWREPQALRGLGGLVSVLEEPRVAVIGTFDTPLGRLAVANTHLSFLPGWGRVQLSRLRRELAAFPEPVVVTGDLNMPAGRPERITGFRSFGGEPTFPGSAPRSQLDHVLVRGAAPATARARAVATAISDHRALVVDIPGL